METGHYGSLGSPLIYTIWVGRQHSSCASSTEPDNRPLDECESWLNSPSKASWELLTSLWPLQAVSGSRLPLTQKPTASFISQSALSVLRTVVSILCLPRGQRLIPDLTCLSKLPWYQSVCRGDTEGFSLVKVRVSKEKKKRSHWLHYSMTRNKHKLLQERG